MKTNYRASAIARIAFLTLVAAGVSAVAIDALAGNAAAPKSLELARLTPNGTLRKPADMTNWVFLGTSLGMGYNPGSFNAANPGQFQVVLMEPKAYRYFVEHGSYAPGSMFVLAFYGTDDHPRSINQHGFTQTDLTNYEIHVIGPAGGPQGHSFFLFGADDTEGTPAPPTSACMSCHVDHGAFNGTFAQFYPTLRPLIPKEALERAAQDHDIH